jgi:hypothetical protein
MYTHRRDQAGGCDMFSAWWNMMTCCMNPFLWSCAPPRGERVEHLEALKKDLEQRVASLDKEIAELKRKMSEKA